MSIYGINATNSSDTSTQALDALQTQTSAASDTSSTSSTASPPTHISGPAKMLSKLKQLAESDPAKFKQVMSDMADKLTALAKKQGDTASSAKLSQVAAQFEEASQTGTLSSLQPPTGSQLSHALKSYSEGSSQIGHLASLMSGLNQTSGSASSTSSAASSSDKISMRQQMNTLFQSFNQEITSALS